MAPRVNVTLTVTLRGPVQLTATKDERERMHLKEWDWRIASA